ncbi:MAG: aminotransferase class I/II-fold pyridoxal phosphate-dependent enzyme, partial [Firmicutes bacterium]|nr:aminotransferase class I/II-fold pyridoxal phosphate-dependent enzyme [Bacillota bacterium]
MSKLTLAWDSMAARAGKGATPPVTTPTVNPIYQTSVFTFGSLEQVDAAFDGQPGGYVYSRIHNPNHAILEAALAELEGGETAVEAASGMAAILIACLAHLTAGDRMLVTRDCYGGMQVQFLQELTRFGITIDFVDFSDLTTVAKKMEAGAKLVYLETISNPLMKLVDIRAISQLAHAQGALVVVDNT